MRAVLTGDLIRSTAAPGGAVDRAMSVLSETVAAADWAAPSAPFTRFRGDGWQVLLDRPAVALRLALVLHAGLRASGVGLATRIGIGLGPITTRGTGDLSGADGPAFWRAGAALDGMKRGRRLDLSPEDAPRAWSAAVPLLDAISQRWTVAQAVAARTLLAPEAPTQAALAQSLGITPQSLADRAAAADLDAVLGALDLLETIKNQALEPDSSQSGGKT